jgi:uncharacterized heparinase superfamily protein
VNRLRLFCTSVRYTRPAQLRARLSLSLRRRALSALARWSRPRTLRREVLDLALAPPQPLFSPRRELAGLGDGKRELRFLDRRHGFALPLDWHPPALERGTRLELLKLHSMEWLEALDDELLRASVDDWVDQNPPHRRHFWLDSWNSYALSIRTVVWMQQLAARRLPPSPKANASLLEQLRFLARNLETDIGGNHLVKNVKALQWAGRFFDGPQAKAWTITGETLLARVLREQVLADGMHFERSPAYHAQVFADLLECCSVLAEGPLRGELGLALDRMAQVLADLTHPDGLPSLFNDGGLHMGYSTADCLAVHARLRDRCVRPRASFALPDAGYFGLRAGGSLLLADCGAIAPDELPAHGHGDALAFEWTLEGQRLIVDAGVSEYDAGTWRELSRSTRAHNTLTVGDEDQCEFWSSFRIARRARVRLEHCEHGETRLALQGSHDGFARLGGSPIHRRRLEATADSIEVQDELAKGAKQIVRSRLLLHPSVQVRRERGAIVLERGRILVRLSCASPMTIEPAWWCPDFNVRQTTLQIVMHYGCAPCNGAFRLELVRKAGECASDVQAALPPRATGAVEVR